MGDGCWTMMLLVSLAGTASAEIIDRIAVTVGDQVITESHLLLEMRVAAFLNGETPDLSPAARRKAAERLVDLALIQHEMELSRYPMPGPPEVEPMLKRVREERGLTDEARYRAELEKYHITDEDVRDHLLRQLATLRFINFRFTPGIDLPEAEVQEYYSKQFLPEWKKKNGDKTPPSLEEARPQIESILNDQRADQALERWLKQARSQTRLSFRSEVFQ